MIKAFYKPAPNSYRNNNYDFKYLGGYVFNNIFPKKISVTSNLSVKM